MQPTSKFRTGIRFGIITGLIYIVLLFCRFKFFAYSPPAFAAAATISFLVVVLLYFMAARARKRELQGYATFKDIFQTVFVTILITEFAYVIFNVIYLRFVDPGFWENFKVTARPFFEKYLKGEEEIDKQMSALDQQGSQMSVPKLIGGYAGYIIIDSIIGMIYSAILRKKKDVFPETEF